MAKTNREITVNINKYKTCLKGWWSDSSGRVPA
jgi:hypothetical protein